MTKPNLSQHKLLLTLTETAASLAISRDHVAALIHSGDLPAIDLGHGTFRVRVADLHRFVTTRRAVTKADRLPDPHRPEPEP
jgi:excisionase family DNA binding protein